MKHLKRKSVALVLVGVVVLLGTHSAKAQESREALISSAQEEKSKNLQPEVQDRVELFIQKMVKGGWFFSPTPRGLYPYFDSVYSGGGLTLGAGYRKFYGDYSFAEFRGLYSLKNYKRFEFRLVTPNHLGGRVDLDGTAGWMDATQISYYGLGPQSTRDNETNFRLQQAYFKGGATVKPFRWFRLRAASGYENIVETEGTGLSPTVGDKFNSTTAPGLGVSPAYVHSEVAAALVWAPSEGYARRVMAFSDELIRAIVKTGQYSDPAAEKHLADVLIKRRDKIGQAYLAAVNPLVDFRLDGSGALTFENAAVKAGVAPAPPEGYEARWYRFDNNSGAATAIGVATVSRDLKIQAPAGLPAVTGEHIKVEVVAVGSPNSAWRVPVQVFFRKVAQGWTLVGLQRLPD